MPLTLAAVHAYATSLPDVLVGTKWNTRTWMVGDKGFAWERPLTKADLGRLGDVPPPVGDIVAVKTDGLDAKDALLAMELPGFFTIQHFNGFPAVLIALKEARATDVRATIREAHRVVTAARPRKRAATGATTRSAATRAGRRSARRRRP